MAQGGCGKPKEWHEGEKTGKLWHFPLHKCSGSDSRQHGYFQVEECSYDFVLLSQSNSTPGGRAEQHKNALVGNLQKSRFILSSRTKLAVEPAPSSVKQASVLRKFGAGNIQWMLWESRPFKNG